MIQESEVGVVGDEEIAMVLDGICTTLLDSTATFAEPQEPPTGEHYVTGCVSISGQWEGAVTFGCTLAFARGIAAAMFDLSPDDLEIAEVHDAVGEITNMTGGNIKALLPGPSQLSIPAVADGIQTAISVPGGTVINRVGLDCQGHNLVVTLYRGNTFHRQQRMA
jgi:chemotaxis protein CheX